MATSILSRRSTSQSAAASADCSRCPDRPAALAAARISRAGLALGGLGLAVAMFVVARLFETWKVSPRVADQVSIFGHKLSYPAANAEAIVVMILAAVGAVATARALCGAIRESQASRRFHRRLLSQHPHRLRGALVIKDPHPRAFCAGLVRPQVYVTTGAVALLDDAALGAVLAHERHHAHRYDPLRLAAGRVLARAVFFLPGLDDLVARQQALAELSADEWAVSDDPENRSALARAMLSFSDAPASAASIGIDPSRVDYLLGNAPSWRFPALLCLTAASVIALLAAVIVLVGQLASGSATLALPFLSSQPCVVVLAAIPIALGALAGRYRRRHPRG
jgi:beta-lactamase regulating signal transducer with metallopeptidase domain